MWFALFHNRFILAIQNALAVSIKNNRFDKNRIPIILHEDEPKVWIDGFKNTVKYGIQNDAQIEIADTLTEFINSSKYRTINLDVLFQKPRRLEFESEFRIVLYPTAGREEKKIFNINDDFRLVECNITNCTSDKSITFER